jgi:hypothetical protein
MENDPIIPAENATPAEETTGLTLEEIKSQIRFAAERYSFRGTNGSRPSEYVQQLPGNYAYPLGESSVIKVSKTPAIDVGSNTLNLPL